MRHPRQAGVADGPLIAVQADVARVEAYVCEGREAVSTKASGSAKDVLAGRGNCG